MTTDPVTYCADDKHEYFDDYYGVRCQNCPWFAAYGCEPWAPQNFDDRSFDDGEYEPDEFEEEMYDCHGYFDTPGPKGVFYCGAVGSEDCDECPMNSWLGLTNRQIDKLEETA